MAEHRYKLTLKRNTAAPQTVSNMASMHTHQQHELYFLVSGQRRYFLGHTIYDVAPGNLVLIPKMQLHRTTSPRQKGYDRFVLFFDETDEAPIIQLLGRENFDKLMNTGCVQLPSDMVRQVQKDLEQMQQELERPTEHSEAVAIHLLHDILLTALRYGTQKECCQGGAAETVQDIARYISEHYADSLTLDDAAQMAHMEKTYFCKRFKELTGFGFSEYLTQTRLREADRLLRETNTSIGEIAEICGFTGSNYFGDVFRRWTGMSPSAYRELIRND